MPVFGGASSIGAFCAGKLGGESGGSGDPSGDSTPLLAALDTVSAIVLLSRFRFYILRRLKRERADYPPEDGVTAQKKEQLRIVTALLLWAPR